MFAYKITLKVRSEIAPGSGEIFALYLISPDFHSALMSSQGAATQLWGADGFAIISLVRVRTSELKEAPF